MTDAEKVVKQVEYYFSANNLTSDKFMRDKMSDDFYLDIDILMTFNKLISFGLDKDTLVSFLKKSTELLVRETEGKVEISCKSIKDGLPKFDGGSRNRSKKHPSLAWAAGGCVLKLKFEKNGTESEIEYLTIKEVLGKSELLTNRKIRSVEVGRDNFEGIGSVWFDHFYRDHDFFTEHFLEPRSFHDPRCGDFTMEYLHNGQECDQLVRDLFGIRVKQQRQRLSTRFKRAGNYPIELAGRSFDNITKFKESLSALKLKYEEERKDLDKEDFDFVKAILEFHPNSAHKLKGCISISVDDDPFGTHTCFYIHREDKSKEDISVLKALTYLDLYFRHQEYAKKSKALSEMVDNGKTFGLKRKPDQLEPILTT